MKTKNFIFAMSVIGVLLTCFIVVVLLYNLPKIVVVTPNKDDVWNKFDTYSIEWEAVESITYIKIELYKETEYIETISSKTENTGTYKFTINESHSQFISGTLYRIKISDWDNNSIYAFSDYFEISIDYGEDDGNNDYGW